LPLLLLLSTGVLLSRRKTIDGVDCSLLRKQDRHLRTGKQEEREAEAMKKKEAGTMVADTTLRNPIVGTFAGKE
jgi:hypothetical protein